MKKTPKFITWSLSWLSCNVTGRSTVFLTLFLYYINIQSSPAHCRHNIAVYIPESRSHHLLLWRHGVTVWCQVTLTLTSSACCHSAVYLFLFYNWWPVSTSVNFKLAFFYFWQRHLKTSLIWSLLLYKCNRSSFMIKIINSPTKVQTTFHLKHIRRHTE